MISYEKTYCHEKVKWEMMAVIRLCQYLPVRLIDWIEDHETLFTLLDMYGVIEKHLISGDYWIVLMISFNDDIITQYSYQVTRDGQ